ncbi:MAG: hypothetical protein K0Q79_1837 [Flavipsychrobacter sp.]|jgi:hypothetical protein|nr:hypothetical protein [Flavipsychrobacter sp.]
MSEPQINRDFADGQFELCVLLIGGFYPPRGFV